MRYTNTPKTSLKGLNAELVKVEEAFKDVLDRKDEEANFMDTDLDMNSHRILNLPSPVLDQEPLRKGDAFPFYDQTESFRDEAVQAAEEAEASASSAQGALDELLAAVTTQALINGSMPSLEVGSTITTTGFYTAGDGGGGKWLLTATTDTPSQTPAQLGEAKLTDAEGRVFEFDYSYNLELIKLGFTDLTKELRTNLVQGVTDYAASLPFGANIISPEGEYEFSGSTLDEAWPNASGGTLSADIGCLVLRENVSYTGAGRYNTKWYSSDATKTLVFLDNGSNCKISKITFSNVYDTGVSGAGHGVFNLVKNLDDAVTNLSIDDVAVSNVASYGLGLNYGYQTNVSVTNFHTDTTGADGIDIKSRATSLSINKVNTISKIRVKNFGLRLDGQVGLDVRGQYTISDCWFTDFGDGVKSFVGLRLRPVSESNNLALGSTVSNIHVLAGSNINTVGVQISGRNNSVTLFSISDCDTGVSGQEGEDCNISNGVIAGHRTNAVKTTVSANNFSMTNVRAVNANGAANHFRIESTGFTESNASGDVSANDWSISTSALSSISRSGGNGSSQDVLDIYQITNGRVGVSARGPSANIDIALIPKGSGKLRLGEHSGLGAESLSGFIEIRDSSGVLRKIAVVS